MFGSKTLHPQAPPYKFPDQEKVPSKRLLVAGLALTFYPPSFALLMMTRAALRATRRLLRPGVSAHESHPCRGLRCCQRITDTRMHCYLVAAVAAAAAVGLYRYPIMWLLGTNHGIDSGHEARRSLPDRWATDMQEAGDLVAG